MLILLFTNLIGEKSNRFLILLVNRHFHIERVFRERITLSKAPVSGAAVKVAAVDGDLSVICDQILEF